MQLSAIRRFLLLFEELEKRKATVLASVEEQGKLTPELRAAIVVCQSSTELEDIYLPFKQKRKTKASIARENGLEPLALFLLEQRFTPLNDVARAYVKNNVKSIDEALEGARHIIAEMINENADARTAVRNLFSRDGVITSAVIKSKAEEAVKYKDYFNSRERLSRCPSHRFLAIQRGAEEGFLRIGIEPEDEDKAVQLLERRFVKGASPASEQVRISVADSYKRLLAPSIETEFFIRKKKKPIRKLLQFLLRTFCNYCWLLHWGIKRCWRSIRDSVRVVNVYASTDKATFSTMRQSILIRLNRRKTGCFEDPSVM